MSRSPSSRVGTEITLAGWRKLGGEFVVIAIKGGWKPSRDDVLQLVETEHLFANWMRDNAVQAVIVRLDRATSTARPQRLGK